MHLLDLLNARPIVGVVKNLGDDYEQATDTNYAC
jgi:hypothetical protein